MNGSVPVLITWIISTILKDAWILSGVLDRKSSKNAEESWTTLKDKISGDEPGVDFGLIFGSWSREMLSFKNCLKLAASWLLIFGLGAALSWILNRETKRDNCCCSKEYNGNHYTIGIQNNGEDG